ncbi:hypothetical protein BH11VER1_BH11VER1_32280 [soil metagenome]
MPERYKIFEELDHRGGHVVLKGYDMQAQSYVTLKQLLTREEADSIAEERMVLFRSESERLTRMSHPCLILFHTILNNEHGICVITELLDGISINSLLMRGPVNPHDFLQIAVSSLSAIGYAHQNEVLHRALTTETIKVIRTEDEELDVYVLDLAYEHMTDAGQQSELSRRDDPDAALYLAPEQWTGGDLGAHTDLYALGCIFYYCLSKKHPFEGDSPQDTMERHLEHMVVQLHDLCPQLPGVLCDWVMWLINAAPECRPASAQVALDSLCVLSGTTLDPVTDTVLEEDMTGEGIVPEMRKRRSLGMFLILSVVAIALTILGWFLFSSGSAIAMPFQDLVNSVTPVIHS